MEAMKYWVRPDVVYKNKSQGAQSSANELSPASLWEKAMVNDIPSRKNQERKYYLQGEIEDPSLPPQIPSWAVTLSGSLQRYLY